jgi:hypothetical protein
MALTRRVAATSVPHQKGSLEGEPSVVELTGTGTTPLLDHVPTQRGAFPEVLEPPAPLPAAPVQERRKGRTAVLVVALTVTGALVAGSAAVAHERSVQTADRHAADLRLAGDRAAVESDFSARYAAQAAAAAAWSTALSSARAAALTAAADGTQQLAAAPHADPALLAALQAAIDLATTTAADESASVAAVSDAAAGVAAPAKAATDAEAAWQVADQARIAAEQQAAAQAAASAAAAQAAEAAAAARPVVRTPVATKPVTSSSTAPAPTGGRVQPIPTGGLVCPGAPVGAATAESSYSAIGAAINAWRAGQGLPALAIARSGSLVGHAEDMAASGGIWHSGFDNIVGCTSGSVTSLINAWANSAPHRAQMVRTDVSTMLIGGATSGGWLYGAVKFS